MQSVAAVLDRYFDCPRRDIFPERNENTKPTYDDSPISNIQELWKGRLPVSSQSFREKPYVFGWARSQFSAPLTPWEYDSLSKISDPFVGVGALAMLAMHHDI